MSEMPMNQPPEVPATPQEVTLHHALVLDADDMIRAVLDSDQPVTAELLAATEYAGMDIRDIGDTAEYAAGHKLAEYTADGKLRPLIDRVIEGLCDPPPGYELVDGELVQASAPAQEATPSIAEKLAELDAVKAQAAAADELINILLGGEIK